MTHPTSGTDDARDAVARHEVERRLSEEAKESVELHSTGVRLTVDHPLVPSAFGDPGARTYVPPSLRGAERHRQGRAVVDDTPSRPPVPPRPAYDLDNIFTYHPPIGDQSRRYGELRAKAREYAELVIKLCPSSPERTLALRQIEMAVHWHNAAIARNEGPGQAGEEG